MRRKAVIISDLHFTPATLELASSALIQAMDKAVHLDVPLIIAGDTLDTKAIIRGECANRLIEMLENTSDIKMLVGNHDLLNEKGKAHSLNFLKSHVEVIESPTYDPLYNLFFIPYQADKEQLLQILEMVPPTAIIIGHQGLLGAAMGHYVQDKTSLPPEAFKRFRTISGHYHKHQTIRCGEAGLFTYVGNPYTLTFGEANDGPKGFLILNDDGSVEHVPTNLRKHIIHDTTYDHLDAPISGYNPGDLVMIRCKGPYSDLSKIKKKVLGEKLLGHSNFKLDLIYTDNTTIDIKIEQMTNYEIFDTIIDTTDESSQEKKYLKNLYRELLND